MCRKTFAHSLLPLQFPSVPYTWAASKMPLYPSHTNCPHSLPPPESLPLPLLLNSSLPPFPPLSFHFLPSQFVCPFRTGCTSAGSFLFLTSPAGSCPPEHRATQEHRSGMARRYIDLGHRRLRQIRFDTKYQARVRSQDNP